MKETDTEREREREREKERERDWIIRRQIKRKLNQIKGERERKAYLDKKGS